MKCIIIYFSQTGNTEKIARAIRDGIMSSAGHCDLLPIKGTNPRRLFDYDLIGLGAPVHRREPPNITAFIKNMRFVGGKHAFSFCTHGTMGYFYNPSVVPQMRKRGLLVIGWNDWYGHSYGPISQPTPYFSDGHPDAIDLKEARDFGTRMAVNSQKIAAGDSSLIPEGPEDPFPMPDFGETGKILNRYQFKNVVTFHQEKCLYPKCRLCMEHCPMDAIDITVKPPVIGKGCMDCTFCEQICPTGALDANDEIQEILLRYNSAFIKKTCVEHVVDAEKAGKLRRYVPDERIGWDTGVYKVFNTHPRFIIGKGRP
jgi:flavodoxin/ferredoxin